MKLPKMFTSISSYPVDLLSNKENSLEKFSRGLRVFLILLIAMFLTTCFHHVQMYRGSPKAESEEGTLTYNPQAGWLHIIKVDSIDPGPADDAIPEYVLHLLPGEHEVLVTPVYFLMGSASTLGSVSDEDEERARQVIDGWLLKFTMEPGHSYFLGADHGGWLENESELILEEPDSVFVFRPKGWRNWSPYICDEVPENRVSVIISEDD